MVVQRTHFITGELREMELPITADQILRYEAGRECIQEIFPNLTPSQREFIQTGTLPEEWDEMFPEED